MKIVTAALCYCLNISAARATEAGVIKRGLHFEFLNGLRRWQEEALKVVIPNVIAINSIELIIVLSRSRTIDRDVLRVASKSGVVGKIDGCARRQPQDLRDVARSQRQF